MVIVTHIMYSLIDTLLGATLINYAKSAGPEVDVLDITVLICDDLRP